MTHPRLERNVIMGGTTTIMATYSTGTTRARRMFPNEVKFNVSAHPSWLRRKTSGLRQLPYMATTPSIFIRTR